VLASRAFTIHTRHADAMGRAKTTRYYGLVQVENRYLHEILLGEGLARNAGTRVALPTGEKAKDYAGALQVLEDRARVQRKGLWSTSDPAKRKSPL
jgi:endonuclease YncB( thermonuclease family)